MNKTNIFLLFTIFLLQACLEQAPVRSVAGSDDKAIIGGPSNGGGNGAAPGDGSFDSPIEVSTPQVEIRHLIEPKIDGSSTTGTYKRKLTIPKNYSGKLYLAGINVSTLAAKNLKVRFKFGRFSSPKTIDATLATAEGLTTSTPTQVLVMDLKSKPFQDISLKYDLFDYNNYDFTNSTPPLGTYNEPVQYNRDDKLFCRGLSLKDDPTFTGDLSVGCVGAGDICKYAFANVVDKGLVREDGGDFIPIIPTESSVASASNAIDNDSNSIKLNRCLHDDPSVNFTDFGYRYRFDTYAFANFFTSQPFDGVTYQYQGPYLATDFAEWEIKSDAILNSFGVFGGYHDLLTTGSFDDEFDVHFGFKSKLFPLQTKLNLLKDVEYYGSAIPADSKSIQTMASNGASQWMDGCNARVKTAHQFTGEHVGSCNITATIELIAYDSSTGTTEVIDITKEVKLQLVKPEQLNEEDENVLTSNLQSCSSSNQCGADSCCISNRCWSKSIVSQCIDDLPTYGNGQVGETCSSDHECGSLCCNQQTGKCSPHDTDANPPVLCSKYPGNTCIGKEWCMKEPVVKCFIVKTGFDTQGAVTCALRCYTVQEHGECQSSGTSAIGTCSSPVQEDPPVFNPADPNRCEDAIDPSEVPISN